MPMFTYDWGRSSGNPLIANEIVTKREVNRYLPLRHQKAQYLVRRLSSILL